jgi:serine/threonine protein kinase
VLHRDIKPANVLLPASRHPAAKLSDFGVAHLAELSGSTPPGAITGTPMFASPEALAGEGVGPPHDVYALSATLYTLFAGGRLPYRVSSEGSITTLRRLQLAGWTKPLRELRPDVDRGVERVLMQALAPDPRLRPSAQTAVLALESAHARFQHTSGAWNARATSTFGSPWRLAAAGVGLMVLGLWKEHLRRCVRSGNPTNEGPDASRG